MTFSSRRYFFREIVLHLTFLAVHSFLQEFDIFQCVHVEVVLAVAARWDYTLVCRRAGSLPQPIQSFDGQFSQYRHKALVQHMQSYVVNMYHANIDNALYGRVLQGPI